MASLHVVSSWRFWAKMVLANGLVDYIPDPQRMGSVISLIPHIVGFKLGMARISSLDKGIRD